MSTSERLRQLRKDLGMSQEEFGRRIGVSNTAISKLEKNERNLTEQTAKSICRELIYTQISISFFICNTVI